MKLFLVFSLEPFGGDGKPNLVRSLIEAQKHKDFINHSSEAEIHEVEVTSKEEGEVVVVFPSDPRRFKVFSSGNEAKEFLLNSCREDVECLCFYVMENSFSHPTMRG
jgi:hypothetical protein